MIIGHVQLNARLDKLADADLEKPMNQAISMVENAARSNCPSDTGELRGSINHYVRRNGDDLVGVCQTNKAYAAFVEFGTGPRGQAEHEGISPDVHPFYTQSPWWIHEGPGPNEVSRETGEKYGWFHIDTPQGRFYQCSGQPAQPFMYPALKDNEEAVLEIFRKGIEEL